MCRCWSGHSGSRPISRRRRSSSCSRSSPVAARDPRRSQEDSLTGTASAGPPPSRSASSPERNSALGSPYVHGGGASSPARCRAARALPSTVLRGGLVRPGTSTRGESARLEPRRPRHRSPGLESVAARRDTFSVTREIDFVGEFRCPNCDEALPQASRFCSNCGTPPGRSTAAARGTEARLGALCRPDRLHRTIGRG